MIDTRLDVAGHLCHQGVAIEEKGIHNCFTNVF